MGRSSNAKKEASRCARGPAARLRSLSVADPVESGGFARARLDALTHARLWRNPCGFAARFNYLALRYNIPLYSWVKQRFGLSRPEFVVLYSLGLVDDMTVSDISASTAFPKNTLSRATKRLIRLGLVLYRDNAGDRRTQPLSLTVAGRAILDEAIPRFVAAEEAMLAPLTLVERETLSLLMAKVVLGMFRNGEGR